MMGLPYAVLDAMPRPRASDVVADLQRLVEIAGSQFVSTLEARGVSSLACCALIVIRDLEQQIAELKAKAAPPPA